jgi:hypothetical protein
MRRLVSGPFFDCLFFKPHGAASPRCLVAMAWTLAAMLLAVAPAGADVFGTISLVSRKGPEQALYAHDPAISGDGVYIAFDGSFGGVTGVWRCDLQTGEVQQVAGGDAELPSISENGQYVSFTTNEGGQLIADTDEAPHSATPEEPNVYVRNMAIAPGEPGTFLLASAADGPGEIPLTYETPEPTLFGSVATGRSALSANGQEVAFVTTATSDLAGEHTPPLQVAVRNLVSHETRLVSTEAPAHAGEPPRPVSTEAALGFRYGAVFSGGAPPPLEPPLSYEFSEAVGASISADGSTVAWMGQDIGAQVPLLPGESVSPYYAEPLWRRITPEAQTRRITGGSDPANPACIESSEKVLAYPPSLTDPCQGPFSSNLGLGTWVGGVGNDIPALSADGNTVAFLAGAPPLALGEDFGKTGNEARHSDIYVSDMSEASSGGAISRVEALTPLTELSTGKETDLTTNASIVDLAISPDGTQVAFTTERTEFPLGSFTDVSVTAPEAGMAELYDVDLDDHTLTRVINGFEGGPSERPHPRRENGVDPYAGESDGALSPSFADDGDTLAFSSTASNLVYGDGNTPPEGGLELPGLDGSDVFVVPRVTFSSSSSPQYISSPPPNPAITPAWRLGVTSRSQRNGSVLLDLELPGAGTVRAAADGSLRVLLARSSRVPRNSVRRRHPSSAVVTRVVASARKTSGTRAGGLVALALTLAPHYRSLAGQRGGFSATVSVVFSAPGHPTLRQSLPVTFVRTPPSPSKKRTPNASVKR